MGLFKKDNEIEVVQKNQITAGSIFGYFLSLVFLPVFAIVLGIFLVFMKSLKWKPTVTLIPLSLVSIIMLLFSGKVVSNITLSEISSSLTSFVFAYLYFSVILGIIGGYFYILAKAWQLKKYPEFVYISGWAYGFEYVPTPLEKWRKKKNMELLKSGEGFDYEKAPVGVIEAPVVYDDLERTKDVKNANKASIVYRYYSEAMAHTLITGKTGSGKALHKDTVIRTKERGWITVGECKVGDTLYDESGNHTKLLDIFYPNTPDHYELAFSNGEKVKACGDHLWNIGFVGNEETFNTRTLYEKFDYTKPFDILHIIDEKLKRHEILRIKKIIDNPKDYMCFTVDSPSKLFLITKSLIPTHNTVTMLTLIQNDVLAGHPVCVIDFKKSPDLIYFLSKWAQENGREFYHFMSGKPGTYKNPYKDNQATYDPLSTGGATSKADMILNLRSWDSASEVFKKRTQDVLQSLFFLLERTPKNAVPEIEWDSGGLAQFVSALDLSNFKKMIEHMAKDMQAGRLSKGDVRRYNTLIELYRELSAKTKSDLKAQITELLSIARTLIVSNYGDWLATGASDYHIDLMNIATSDEGPVVLFSFNQQEEPEFAKYIGSIVMSDLSRVSALKNAKGDVTKFGVYIDEFQTLDPRTVKDNLEKARSSKMYITLSLQSIDQIVSSVETGDGESMANAILDTCSNFIFHDGAGYDTAEKMAKIIGKSNKYLYKTTSNTRPGFIGRLVSVDKAMVGKDVQEDWLVPPSEFQSLESPTATNGYKSTAYVVNKASDDERFKRGGGALARKVHVVVANETAKGLPKGFKEQIFVDSTGKEESFEELQADVLKNLHELGIDTTVKTGSSGMDAEGDWEITEEEEENIMEGLSPLVPVIPDVPAQPSNPLKQNPTSIKKPMIEDSEDFDLDEIMKYQENKVAPVPKTLPSSPELEKRGVDDIVVSTSKNNKLDMFNALKNKKPEAKPSKEKKKTSVPPKEENTMKLPDLD